MFQKNTNIRIFLLSFLILFLELSLIRWIPAHIRLVSYFANVILLGTFLGIGVGFLLARLRVRLVPWFPLLLLLLVSVVLAFRIEVNIASPDVLYFSDIVQQTKKLEPEILLPILFSLVAITFVPLAQELGRLFTKIPPLTAYTLDIVGSIAGILFFSLGSYFWVPAPFWFITISVLTYLVYIPKTWHLGVSWVLVFIAIVILTAITNRGTWSPYYNITLTKQESLWGINANNIEHQFISDYAAREPFYYVPYEIFPHSSYKTALIIGAGTGADTAVLLALSPSIEYVDAVEIDPVIADLGKKLNPNKPFDDPRVHLTITDGRSFLENSTKTYDLIIFAMTDSLVVTGTSPTIRLESFLFTKEAFEQARKHLTDRGLFVLYNYYRTTWLIDKLARMVQDVYGYPPYVIRYGQIAKAAAIFAGPKTNEVSVKNHLTPYKSAYSLPVPRDSWPFLYLKERTIPTFYLTYLGIIMGISLVFIVGTVRLAGAAGFDKRFFLFGAGFMLLETKSLVTFGLLFGTTWVVNALVFAGILGMILVANVVSTRVTIRRLLFVYIALFVMLILHFVVAPSIFFHLPLVPRYIGAIIFYFLPIFFANLLFSQLFKKGGNADIRFGSNLLGAVFGGILEYGALAIGYQYLVIVIMGCYALSLLRFRRV